MSDTVFAPRAPSTAPVSTDAASGIPQDMAERTTTTRHGTEGRSDGPDGRAGQLETSVARGRGAGGMAGLLGSVAFLVWGAFVVLAVLLLLIWWLA